MYQVSIISKASELRKRRVFFFFFLKKINGPVWLVHMGAIADEARKRA